MVTPQARTLPMKFLTKSVRDVCKTSCRHFRTMKKQSSLELRNIVNSEPAEQYRQITFTAFVD